MAVVILEGGEADRGLAVEKVRHRHQKGESERGGGGSECVNDSVG